MKTTILLSITLSSILLIGCGGGAGESTNKKDSSTERRTETPEPTATTESIHSGRSLAKKIIFNKSYKDTVSKENKVDWFVLKTAKANHEYYLHLKNLGDRNENYSYTYVPYSILDDEGEILKGKLSTVVGENTYAFTTKNDGNLFIKFDSNYNLGNYSSRFEFEVKNGLEEGMVQNNTTFEYNNFQKLSYPIEMNKIYQSTATGTSDSDDWYVLENVDSAKETYLHFINLGDRNENPSMNAIQCEILDEKGKIIDINLPTTVKEKTYTIQPIQDGKIYLHFYTHLWGANYGDMRYSFDIK